MHNVMLLMLVYLFLKRRRRRKRRQPQFRHFAVAPCVNPDHLFVCLFVLNFGKKGTGSDEKFITGTNNAVPIVRMDRGGEGMS